MLRGVLFLLILAYHCDAPYSNFGWAGVESFLVLSAFFLVKKYWGEEKLNVGEQFKHRAARLYPPYVAVLIIAALYALLRRALPYDIIPHLLSAQNFLWMITGYSSPMQPMTAHTWTLSIEVWGGLVWLLLRFVPKKQFRAAMYGMLAAGVLYRTMTILHGCEMWIITLCPVAHFDAFAVGSLLAIREKENKSSKRTGLLAVLGLIGIIASILLLAQEYQTSFLQGYRLLASSKIYLNWFTGNVCLFISLLTAGIVGLMLLHDNRINAEVGKIRKWFVALGDNSYNLYLFHWLILTVFKKFVDSWAILFLIVFIISIIASLVFNKMYFLIQKKISGGK